MASIARSRLLTFGAEVRHVVFWDDHTLLLTTPAADVWRVDIGSDSPREELLFPASRVLAPVAQAVGQPDLRPAAGDYPRLAASAASGAVVVNTHDLVLVACPLAVDQECRLLCLSCGLYYPGLAFSHDASRFSAESDHLLVFDTATWRGKVSKRLEICCWHPSEPLLLGVDEYDGAMRWTDWRNVEHPAVRPLGTFDPSGRRVEPCELAVAPTGDQCVLAYRLPNRLEWWRLDPPGLLATCPFSDGEIFDLRPHPAYRWFAVVCEAGVRLWDFEKRRPVGRLVRGASDISFSPSGRWFVALSRGPTNPLPLTPVAVRREVALWRFSAG